MLAKHWLRKPIEEKIAETILGAALGGMATISPIAAVAGLFIASGAAERYLFRKSDFNREAKRLQKKGYIALTKTEKGWLVKILKKGRRRYAEIEMAKLELSRTEPWDGKWRLFIFDIPEAMRSRRDSLRDKLKNLGLYNIQRSVFVYPFDCRKELDFIADFYDLRKFTTYSEVSYTDIDWELKKHFKSLKILS